MPEEPVAGSQSSVGSEKPAESKGEVAAGAEIAKAESSAGENVAEKPAPPSPAVPAAAKPTTPSAPGAVKPATPAIPGTPAAKPVTPADGTAKPAASAIAGAKPAAPAAAKAAVPPKPEAPKPEPWNSPIPQFLKKTYGSGVKEASTYVGQNYLVVDKTIVHEVLSILREEEQFDYCVDLTAVHYPKKDEQFEIVYILYSFPHNQRVRVKTAIKDGEKVATVSDIWPTANWLEREVFDMFGIEFEGHPDLRRILLPEDWKGFPLRKDHDILKQDNEWVHIHLGIESGQ